MMALTPGRHLGRPRTFSHFHLQFIQKYTYQIQTQFYTLTFMSCSICNTQKVQISSHLENHWPSKMTAQRHNAQVAGDQMTRRRQTVLPFNCAAPIRARVPIFGIMLHFIVYYGSPKEFPIFPSLFPSLRYFPPVPPHLSTLCCFWQW